jgi:tRNA (guanine37-N1)-methyltransferase
MDGLCLKVQKTAGEVLRSRLIELGSYDKEREIVKDGDYLYIPVNINFDPAHISESTVNAYELVEYDCPKKERKLTNYRELLSTNLSEEQVAFLPRAFDAIGHIAIIKLPSELEDIRFEIGESIIESHKNIRSVFNSTGIHHEFRLPELELIAGEDNSRGAHIEYGIHLDVDVKQVYFSPRLATERYRVASKVRSHEIVLDMFAGVGPFSIMIAKQAKPEKITAVDINPVAVRLMKKNIKKNSVSNIEVFEGDVKDIAPTLPELGNFHRVIMNLPHSAFNFLPEALLAVGNEGLIHYYEIFNHAEIDEKIDELKAEGQKHNVGIETIASRKVHTYSPMESLIGFDIKISK